MRIAFSGSSGLVGAALGPALRADGHEVVPIRRDGGPGITWDGGGRFAEADLRACDAVIHLAGAGIAERRWSAARRRELHDSRVIGTAALARVLGTDPGNVRTLIVASATGFYGDRGEDEVDEDAAVGTGFLAGLCRAWEEACAPCRARVRVVNLRLGVVLSPRGGALAQLLPSARFGLAGALGHGRQWWPWIALSDLPRVITHILATPSLAGPVNALAPLPLRQRELAYAVAAALHRPAWGPPAPRWLLRLALGGMVDEVLLASCRAVPNRLMASGFAWRHPDLRSALAGMLGPST